MQFGGDCGAHEPQGIVERFVAKWIDLCARDESRWQTA